MEVSGDYKFKAPPDKVWQVLMTRECLEKALPGCEKLEEIGFKEYDATLKVGVASIKGTYNGKIRLTNIEELKHYSLVVEGAGAQGHLNGEAVFDIESGGEWDKFRTIVKYKGVANVGGTLAGIGARMLSPVAKLMIGNFFKSIEKQVEESW
jgi:carbon monoxide dehydrogenase subunit G